MMKKAATSIAAIAGICAMQMWAMAYGHNGVLLTLAVAAVAGLGGYKIARAGFREEGREGEGRGR